MNTARRQFGFTLIELLVVIAILGILAALAVPALKNLGKSHVQVSAARQMLDDVGRARQLAINDHTTVYMVFVPGITNSFAKLPESLQTTTATNLLDKQYTGYNFLSLRSVGDQPGRSTTHYLAEWKSLPDGAFIATNKFNKANYTIKDSTLGATYTVNQFNYTNQFPFPTETSPTNGFLPYIAFNYLGQLTLADGVTLAPDEYIPLAQGTVLYAADPNTKALQWAVPNSVAENPAGNSTNSMFTLIHIDHLTGRATVLQQNAQ